VTPTPLVSPVVAGVLGLLAAAVEPVTTAEPERWDPPWLEVLIGVSVVLVALAFLWWLLLVVRMRDRDRGRRDR
jgi:protein-S-isoprenylcysteine O-methyltransferase Ste14